MPRESLDAPEDLTPEATCQAALGQLGEEALRMRDERGEGALLVQPQRGHPLPGRDGGEGGGADEVAIARRGEGVRDTRQPSAAQVRLAPGSQPSPAVTWPSDDSTRKAVARR